jgi:hypothetical protein
MNPNDGTVSFLRMAAIELRHLAESAAEIREPLLNMAQQLEAEADELAGRPQANSDTA